MQNKISEIIKKKINFVLAFGHIQKFHTFDEKLLTFSFRIMTSVISHSMAWTNERLKFSSADNVGLKTLWKMLVFDNSSGKEVKC